MLNVAIIIYIHKVIQNIDKNVILLILFIEPKYSDNKLTSEEFK